MAYGIQFFGNGRRISKKQFMKGSKKASEKQSLEYSKNTQSLVNDDLEELLQKDHLRLIKENEERLVEFAKNNRPKLIAEDISKYEKEVKVQYESAKKEYLKSLDLE